MQNFEATFSLIHFRHNAPSVFFPMQDGLVIEAFIKQPEDDVFWPMLVRWCGSGGNQLTALCEDSKTGRCALFRYVPGEKYFFWDEELLTLPSAYESFGVTLFEYGFTRVTEHMFVGDDVLVVVRRDDGDIGDTKRRLYVGEEDGSNMHHVEIKAYLVHGDGGIVTIKTDEGDLKVFPSYDSDDIATWGSVPLYLCDPSQFAVFESDTGLTVQFAI